MRLLVSLREARGDRTLKALADQAGVSQGELSKIERGIALARDEQIPDLEAAYGLPVEHWYSRRALLALVEDDR